LEISWRARTKNPPSVIGIAPVTDDDLAAAPRRSVAGVVALPEDPGEVAEPLIEAVTVLP
jgi:hypothetical protein